jgi:hypothetical protein
MEMSVKIHGKEYITVDERVREFHSLYPEGCITTQLIEFGERVVVKAIAIPDVASPDRIFTGYAYEVEGSSQINRTSALENCETSAVGRALGFLGIGLVGSIASADEVQNAVHQQEYPSEEQKAEYQELLSHDAFKGGKKKMNDWWKTLNRVTADGGLEQMKKRIEQYENK